MQQVRGVKTIYAYDNRIVYVSGLSKLRGLENLYLQDNRVTSSHACSIVGTSSVARLGWRAWGEIVSSFVTVQIDFHILLLLLLIFRRDALKDQFGKNQTRSDAWL